MDQKEIQILVDSLLKTESFITNLFKYILKNQFSNNIIEEAHELHNSTLQHIKIFNIYNSSHQINPVSQINKNFNAISTLNEIQLRIHQLATHVFGSGSEDSGDKYLDNIFHLFNKLDDNQFTKTNSVSTESTKTNSVSTESTKRISESSEMQSSHSESVDSVSNQAFESGYSSNSTKFKVELIQPLNLDTLNKKFNLNSNKLFLEPSIFLSYEAQSGGGHKVLFGIKTEFGFKKKDLSLLKTKTQICFTYHNLQISVKRVSPLNLNNNQCYWLSFSKITKLKKSNLKLQGEISGCIQKDWFQTKAFSFKTKLHYALEKECFIQNDSFLFFSTIPTVECNWFINCQNFKEKTLLTHDSVSLKNNNNGFSPTNTSNLSSQDSISNAYNIGDNIDHLSLSVETPTTYAIIPRTSIHASPENKIQLSAYVVLPVLMGSLVTFIWQKIFTRKKNF